MLYQCKKISLYQIFCIVELKRFSYFKNIIFKNIKINYDNLMLKINNFKNLTVS